MTPFELSDMFKKAAELAEKLPAGIVEECRRLQSEELPGMLVKLTKCIDALQLFYQTVETAETALCKAYDDTYDKVVKKRIELQSKLEALPPMPEIRFPFVTKDLIEITERCSHLTDEQWKRVIALANSLSEKET